MRYRGQFSALVFLLALVTAPAQSESSAPSMQKWVLDESGYYCALATKVSGPPDGTLVLRTLPGTGSYDLTLVGDRWPPKITGARKQVALAFLPGNASESRSPESAFLDRDRMISLRGIGGKLLDNFEPATGVELRVDGKPVVRYALPPNGEEASQALAKCVASKLIEAGADPAGFEPGASWPKPIGDQEKWMDMPPLLSMGDGEGAHAAVMLDLDTAGKPTDCVILELIGRLDRQRVCKNLLERARYEPARDSKGKPIRSITVYDLDEIVRVTTTLETFGAS
jgi:hypothetical protein